MNERKIIPFPGPGERAIRAAEKAGAVDEVFPVLSAASVARMRQIIQEERESGDAPYRFGETKLNERRAELAGMTLKDAVLEINAADEDHVHRDPARYIALLELVEARTATPQDD